MRALVLAFVLISATASAKAHDALAWADPERDNWFRSLRTPPESGVSISCCDFTDGHQAQARQQGSTWFVLIDAEWVPVPPERVVQTPLSIDGEAYLFRMPYATPNNPHRIRCFVPPIPGY